MVLKDKTGTIYEKFKKPLKKGENQQFGDDSLNLLFQNYKKFIHFLENIRKNIITKIKKLNLYNLKLLIKLKIKEIDSKNENQLKNINCKYILSNPKLFDISKKRYVEKNILINEKYDKFELFISDIIKIIYNVNTNLQNSQNNPIFSIILSSIKMNSSNIISNSSSKRNIIQMMKKFHEYKIIDFITIIQTHNYSAEYIKEVNNGTFISGGLDENVIFYDNNFNQIEEIKQPNLGFFDYEEEEKVVIFSKKELYIKLYNNYSQATKINTNFKIINIVYLKSKTIFACTPKGIIKLTDFMNSIMKTQEDKIYDKAYINGIKINDKIVGFTSNSFLLNGEDKLIFYNINSRKIIKKDNIKGFSFTLSRNNLIIIDIPKIYDNKGNNKILLCACKKYFMNQKNGILLIRLEINGNNINKNIKFYNTRNFEVYCFCPIFKIKDKSIFNVKNKKEIINVTEYILVGGFDIDRQQGLIKLYKIIYNKNIELIKLDYVLDVNIEKSEEFINEFELIGFKGFKGPITCISQSSHNEKILISCSDGNIYLFTEPNIERLENLENFTI